MLRADIYRPAAGTDLPVLLMRNPYGEPMVRLAPVVPAVEAGFAVVVQHCRGTGTSDGDFVPFEHEAADGVDTIEWCARQPWCNGRVGMYGPSYLGMVQLAAATAAPPALRALAPSVTPADYYWGLAFRQGAFQLGQSMAWHTLKSAQELAYRAGAGEDVSRHLPALMGLMASPAAGYAHLPVRDAPVVSEVLPSWRTWLRHEERGEYWSRLSYAGLHSRVTAPAFHVGGWFDLFLGGTLDNFVALSRGAATGHARRNQRLVIGPWTHVDQTGAAGELHFGGLAGAMAIQLERMQLDFLGSFLLPGRAEPGGPPVKLFVMGANVWGTRTPGRWPGPGGTAGTCTGTGHCPGRRRWRGRRRRHTCTTRPTRCRPWAARR